MSDTAAPRISFEEYAKTFRARVFGAVAILFSGLVLVFFSGCFMIGVLVVLWPELETGVSPTGNLRGNSLLYVLYAMAATCFISGMLLVGKGFAATSKVISERP